MMIHFKYKGDVIWTGELGLPIPRTGEALSFDFPADTNHPATTERFFVTTVEYFVKPGLGSSRVDVTLQRLKPET